MLVGCERYYTRTPHTQVLNIFVTNNGKGAALCFARSLTRAEALEDDDSIGGSSRNKGGAVRVACPTGVVVHGDVGEGVAEGAKEQSDMTDEPGKLEGLCELQQPLLQRQIGWRWRSHDELL